MHGRRLDRLQLALDPILAVHDGGDWYSYVDP
jgi:hypothetical protein